MLFNDGYFLGLTGGMYKAQGEFHRAVLLRDY